ncbi:MAG: prepilin-type N-terminal cleavage/methylation domain-containing protein [Planctomycetota bacterium]|nr:prepilin-type N-terminal cleavage/methylation domain-containing protein [Planctomycetota bacterium]
MNHPATIQHRRGFTLVEVVTAMGISSVVLVGMGTAVLVASRAVPAAQSRHASVVSLAEAGRMMTEDLSCATSFLVIDGRAVEFLVPDRDRDGKPEQIRYEWSPGNSPGLTRQTNGGGSTTISDPLNAAAFTYQLGSKVVTEHTTEQTTSAETLLANFDGWALAPLPTITNNPVGTASWAAQYFTINRIALPSTVTAIALTRVRLVLQRTSTVGTLSVGIHAAGTGVRPATIPVGTPAVLAASSLPSFAAWVDLPMPADVRVEANVSNFVIVVKGTQNATATAQMYSSILATADGGIAMWSNDSGSTWLPAASTQNSNDHRFAVYGTYTTTNTAHRDLPHFNNCGSGPRRYRGTNPQ